MKDLSARSKVGEATLSASSKVKVTSRVEKIKNKNIKLPTSKNNVLFDKASQGNQLLLSDKSSNKEVKSSINKSGKLRPHA